MIFSIGYQKLSVSDLIKVVELKDIGLVVDIRTTPYSRKPEFNRNRLMEVFTARYIWKGDVLGGKGGVPAKPEGFEWLRDQGEDNQYVRGHNVLLLCMENHPWGCHRYYDVARRLYLSNGIEVIHLFDGEEKSTSELGG